MTITLTDWIQNELNKRGWDQAELSRRSGIAQSHLSRVLSNQRNVGPDFCNSIARAFHLPPESIFRIAGLLPPKPDEPPMSFKEAMCLFAKLDEPMRHIVLTQMRALVESQEEKEPTPPIIITAPQKS